MRFKHGVVDDEDLIEINQTEPELDECRSLFLLMIKQAAEDFILFRNKTQEEHREIFYTASGFLFDPSYTFNWGDKDISLDEVAEQLNLNVNWIRKRIASQIEVRLSKDGIVSELNIKKYR